jgi:hypothetical protein
MGVVDTEIEVASDVPEEESQFDEQESDFSVEVS